MLTHLNEGIAKLQEEARSLVKLVMIIDERANHSAPEHWRRLGGRTQ